MSGPDKPPHLATVVAVVIIVISVAMLIALGGIHLGEKP